MSKKELLEEMEYHFGEVKKYLSEKYDLTDPKNAMLTLQLKEFQLDIEKLKEIYD